MRGVINTWCLLLMYIVPFCLAQSVIKLPAAYCDLRPTQEGQGFSISGGVKFQVLDFKTLAVTAVIRATLPDGSYSMSVYEYGDLTDPAGLHTGNIFGRNNVSHSCPPNPKRREGDMGNWTLTNGAINETKQFTSMMSLTNPFTSVVGLSVVLRARSDDCTGEDGNSGPRLAQCVIGIANQIDNQADYMDSVTNGICSFQPTNGPYCQGRPCAGTAWFTRDQSGMWMVTAKVSGLAPGAYGFHIHEFGDLSSGDGYSAGGHYNPFGHYHNLPPIIPRHVGDLGSLQSFDKEGNAWYRYIDQNLGEDISPLIGRAMVIHSTFDHGSGLGCDQSGSAGTRVMWCVIGVAKSEWGVPPPIPKDVVIDNTWKSVPCGSGGDGGGGGGDANDDTTDAKVVAIVIGWLLAVFFFFTTVGVAACWYQSRRKGYTDIGDGGVGGRGHRHRLDDDEEDDDRSKYKRRYGRY